MAGKIYSKPILFTLMVTVAVLAGSIVMMAYPMLRPDMHPKLENLRPFTRAAARRPRRLPARGLRELPHPDGAAAAHRGHALRRLLEGRRVLLRPPLPLGLEAHRPGPGARRGQAPGRLAPGPLRERPGGRAALQHAALRLDEGEQARPGLGEGPHGRARPALHGAANRRARHPDRDGRAGGLHPAARPRGGEAKPAAAGSTSPPRTPSATPRRPSRRARRSSPPAARSATATRGTAASVRPSSTATSSGRTATAPTASTSP